MTPVDELIGGMGGLGWVAVKAVLLFAVAVIGLRLGERRTLAQLGAFDFAAAVGFGTIIGRTATAADTSFATGATALVTLLAAHRVVAFLRQYGRVAWVIDHPPRVLMAHGKLVGRELARAGLTPADVYALLRQRGVADPAQVGYLLYETKGNITVVGAGAEPGTLMRYGLATAGYDGTSSRSASLRQLVLRHLGCPAESVSVTGHGRWPEPASAVPATLTRPGLPATPAPSRALSGQLLAGLRMSGPPGRSTIFTWPSDGQPAEGSCPRDSWRLMPAGPARVGAS